MNTQDKNNQAEAEQIFLESCIALTEVAADLVDTVEEQRRIIDLQRELIKTQGELIKRDNRRNRQGRTRRVFLLLPSA